MYKSGWFSGVPVLVKIEFSYLFSSFKHFIIVFSHFSISVFFYLKKNPQKPKNLCTILVAFQYRMEVAICMFNSPSLLRSLIKFFKMNIQCQ